MKHLNPERRRLSFALLLIALTLFPAAGTTAAPQTTITGEIVETFCWAAVRVGGPSHAKCGIECAKRGIPVAIYDAKTRKAYVLLPARDKGTIPPALIEAMGHNGAITGEVVTRAGSSFLMVKSWKRMK